MRLAPHCLVLTNGFDVVFSNSQFLDIPHLNTHLWAKQAFGYLLMSNCVKALIVDDYVVLVYS